MKIFFVTPTFRPSFYKGSKGGGEISNQIILEELAKKGNRIYAISMSPILQKRVYRDGQIIVIELGVHFFIKKINAVLSLLLFKSMFSNLLKRINPDIVISNTSTIKVTTNISKKHNIPAGAMLRAMENLPSHGWSWSKTSLEDTIKYLSHKLTIGWPGKNEVAGVDFFISNSKFLAQKYLNLFPDKKNFIIYPSLNIKKSATPLPTKIKKVMMVGASEEKGFNVFCEISKSFPLLEFHAIGDRSLRNDEVKIANGVTIHGWMHDPIPFIDKMDLVLVPSIWEEPFGRIAVEALYRNKFVLVSNKGGLPEAVSEQSKLIIQTNEIYDWITKIKDLEEDPESYSDSITTATKLSSKFELNYQLNQLCHFLEEVKSSI